MSEKIKCLGDRGYQGIEKYHENSWIPKKKSKNRHLSKEEKHKNREQARLRIIGEHVNRRLKIFRILSERYSNPKWLVINPKMDKNSETLLIVAFAPCLLPKNARIFYITQIGLLYRNRRRRFGLRLNLIAGLYNHELKNAKKPYF